MLIFIFLVAILVQTAAQAACIVFTAAGAAGKCRATVQQNQYDGRRLSNILFAGSNFTEFCDPSEFLFTCSAAIKLARSTEYLALAASILLAPDALVRQQMPGFFWRRLRRTCSAAIYSRGIIAPRLKMQLRRGGHW